MTEATTEKKATLTKSGAMQLLRSIGASFLSLPSVVEGIVIESDLRIGDYSALTCNIRNLCTALIKEKPKDIEKYAGIVEQEIEKIQRERIEKNTKNLTSTEIKK